MHHGVTHVAHGHLDVDRAVRSAGDLQPRGADGQVDTLTDDDLAAAGRGGAVDGDRVVERAGGTERGVRVRRYRHREGTDAARAELERPVVVVRAGRERARGVTGEAVHLRGEGGDTGQARGIEGERHVRGADLLAGVEHHVAVDAGRARAERDVADLNGEAGRCGSGGRGGKEACGQDHSEGGREQEPGYPELHINGVLP